MKVKDLEILRVKSMKTKDCFFHQNTKFIRFLMYTLIRLNSTLNIRPNYLVLLSHLEKENDFIERNKHLQRFVYYASLFYRLDPGKDKVDFFDKTFLNAINQYKSICILTEMNTISIKSISDFSYMRSDVFRDFLDWENKLRKGVLS